MAKKRVRRAAKRMPVFATAGWALTAADIFVAPPDGYGDGALTVAMQGNMSGAMNRVVKNATNATRYKYGLIGTAVSYGASKLKLGRFLPFRP